MKRARRTEITIDVADYLDWDDVECMDEIDTRYVRDCLQDARRCLNRPERNPAEAIEYIERALGTVNKNMKGLA